MGAVAGAVGTVAMISLMKPTLAGYLPAAWRPTQFVPKQIIAWTERRLGAPHALSADEQWCAAAVTHLGYGATMGALYGVARDRFTGMPAPLAGLLWGQQFGPSAMRVGCRCWECDPRRRNNPGANGPSRS